jgi:hypothetical protein
MKTCAMGFNVRFFNVMITTGHFLAASLTGNTFSDIRSAYKSNFRPGKNRQVENKPGATGTIGTQVVARRSAGWSDAIDDDCSFHSEHRPSQNGAL